MKTLVRLVLVFALLGVAGVFGGRQLLGHWESNPVLRGRELAEKSGCMNCHRPFGAKEIPNPGSRWSVVPALEGGNAVMYAKNRQDIEEFIRLGAPSKWMADAETRKRLESQHIRMPAFGERFSESEISDLVAFACAEGDFDLPGGDAAEEGREVARNNGCLSCHGVEGSGGLPNPGSIGGFIPGFVGKNFDDLVKNESEFREWVQTGTSLRLEKNPVVRAFWRRQKIAMPAFNETLDAQETGKLWAWVSAIRSASASGKGKK